MGSPERRLRAFTRPDTKASTSPVIRPASSVADLFTVNPPSLWSHPPGPLTSGATAPSSPVPSRGNVPVSPVAVRRRLVPRTPPDHCRRGTTTGESGTSPCPWRRSVGALAHWACGASSGSTAPVLSVLIRLLVNCPWTASRARRHRWRCVRAPPVDPGALPVFRNTPGVGSYPAGACVPMRHETSAAPASIDAYVASPSTRMSSAGIRCGDVTPGRTGCPGLACAAGAAHAMHTPTAPATTLKAVSPRRARRILYRRSLIFPPLTRRASKNRRSTTHNRAEHAEAGERPCRPRTGNTTGATGSPIARGSAVARVVWPRGPGVGGRANGS